MIETASARDQESNGAPMVEIFGGLFALLLVLFLIMNLLSQAALVERIAAGLDEGGGATPGLVTGVLDLVRELKQGVEGAARAVA